MDTPLDELFNRILRRLYLIQAACAWEDKAATPDTVFAAINDQALEIEAAIHDFKEAPLKKGGR